MKTRKTLILSSYGKCVSRKSRPLTYFTQWDVIIIDWKFISFLFQNIVPTRVREPQNSYHEAVAVAYSHFGKSHNLPELFRKLVALNGVFRAQSIIHDGVFLRKQLAAKPLFSQKFLIIDF